MNAMFQDVIDTAKQLPETEQRELALQIEHMIVQRKIAVGEASYAEHGGTPLDEAFTQIKNRLKEHHGS